MKMTTHSYYLGFSTADFLCLNECQNLQSETDANINVKSFVGTANVQCAQDVK